MPTKSQDCLNYQINLQMCPCTNVECANRGICCECLQAHAAAGSASACMRGAKRDPATLALARNAAPRCAANLERNLAFCTCTYEPCGNKGTCCNCVRNHWTADGAGRAACMRAFA